LALGPITRDWAYVAHAVWAWRSKSISFNHSLNWFQFVMVRVAKYTCPSENTFGEFSQTPAGDAHAQQTPKQTPIEMRIKVQTIGYRYDLVLVFGHGNFPDIFPVFLEKRRINTADQEGKRPHVRIKNLLKQLLFELFRRAFKAGAEHSLKIPDLVCIRKHNS
jgi:hypothetical protein